MWIGLMLVLHGCKAQHNALVGVPSLSNMFVVDQQIDYQDLVARSGAYDAISIIEGGGIRCPSGDCALNKALIINSEQKVFFGDGKFVFTNNVLPVLNPRYWGALPDDQIDDYDAIQKTIDVAALKGGVSAIEFDGGLFTISKPLIVGRIVNNAFTFFGLTIEGKGKVYDINTSLANVTIIKADFDDGFVFGLQACRGVVLKNLTLVGNNRRSQTLNEVYELGERQWNEESVRDDRFSPYSGIVIDPFCEGIPAGGGYQGFEDLYISNRGSSAVTIEGCKISGFVTGICISPNGTTAQGDNIFIKDCFIDYTKAGIAIGQSQSRCVVVDNLTIHNARIVFDSQSYGAQQGQLPEVNGVMATQVQWLFKCSSGVAHGHFRNVFAEEIYGIGYSTNPYGVFPINFNQCTFMFRFPEPFENKRTKANPALLQGNMVSFNGCSLGYSADINKFAPLNFDVTNLSFINSTLDLPVINSNLDYYQKLHNVHYDNVLFKCIKSNAGVRTGGTLYQINPEQISSYLLAPGQSVVDQMGTSYSNLTNGYDYYEIDHRVAIQVDEMNLEATVSTTLPGLYQTGDQILIDLPNQQTGIGNHVRTCIGTVKEWRNGKIILGSIAYGLEDGTYTTYCARLPKLKYRSSGDLNEDSTFIRNVSSDIDLNFIWKVGDKINGEGIVRGTYIVNIDANSIELSHPVDRSVTGVVLEDALIRKEADVTVMPVSGTWKMGDRIHFLNNNTGSAGLRFCSQSGTYGTTTEPVFGHDF